MIETREGLIDALYEAAELEHGLLLQYLFAALTLKKRLDEGLTGAQQELIRIWEGQILLVAREEMAHLGTVCNLLSAIGAAPRFSRPNFPQPAKEYYPFNFTLTPLSDHTLYRFVRFELPKGEPMPAPPLIDESFALAAEMEIAVIPEPLEYEYIGELYGQIRDAFNKLDETELFIGPKSAQEEEFWSRRMQIMRVVDRTTANDAIDDIILDGEGSPAVREGSHYNTFLNLRKELSGQPGLKPARPVVTNPRTRPHRDSSFPATIIENPDAKDLTELFGACYEIVLMMLLQLYSYGGETLGERNALRAASRNMMTMVIRPISEILTEIPAMNDPALGTAGPSFELYSPLALSTQVQNRWSILNEKFRSVAAATFELATINPRLNFIGENIRLLQTNINSARGQEERL